MQKGGLVQLILFLYTPGGFVHRLQDTGIVHLGSPKFNIPLLEADAQNTPKGVQDTSLGLKRPDGLRKTLNP